MLKNLWPAKIRTQLILGIALVHLGMMAFFVFDMVERQRTFLKKQNHDQTVSLVSDFAVNANSFIVSNDFDRLERLVRSHGNFPNLKYAMILSPDGLVLAHTNTAFVGLNVSDSISLRLRNVRQTQTLIENNRILDIAVPILQNRNIVGWARVGVGQEYIYDNLFIILRNGILYIVLALVIGSFFAFLIGRKLSNGLYKLIDVTKKIKNGDRNVRVAGSNSFEIDELGMALNQMLDEISTNERLLSKMLENMPVGVWIINEKGDIVSANAAAKEIWGGAIYGAIEVYSEYKAWNTVTHRRIQPNEWGATIALEKGIPVLNQEIAIEGFDKSRKILLNSAIPLTDSNGKINGAIAINVDITEEKENTAKLKEREGQLRIFVEHSPASLAMFDAEMNYMVVSRRWLMDYGLKEKEVIGRCHYDVFPNVPERWKQIHQRCLTGTIEKCEEDTVIGKNGALEWIKWEIHPWCKASGEIGGIIMLTEVITEKKETDLRFKNLVEKALIGIWIIQNERFVYVNPRLAEKLGYTDDELLQMDSIYSVIYHKDIELVKAKLQLRLEGETENTQYEIRCRRKDGKIIWVEVNGSETLFMGAKAVIGVMKNITERKEFESLILHEKKLSETIINGLPGIFYMADKEGRLIRWNKNFETISGYTHREVGQMYATDFVEISEIDLALSIRQEAFLRGKASVEMPILTKQKHRLIFYITFMPVLYNDEQYILGIGIDFTEKKKTERALLKKNWENNERVKELRCLYKLSELSYSKQLAIEDIMIECVAIIPPAYQYPDITYVKLEFGDKSFKSQKFFETEWKQEASISIKGNKIGKLSVYYSEERPVFDEGPFLNEERYLITSIAEILSNAIERKMAEGEVLKLNRLYQFTSNINEMMLRAADDETIFAEACQIAIDHGGFQMAWVGLYNEVLDSITPVAWAGNENGFLEAKNYKSLPVSTATTPVARAIRSRKPYCFNNVSNNPGVADLRELMLERNYQSGISLPILVNGKVVAAFIIMMSESNFFNETEIKLLQKVTDNIAYALDKVRIKHLQVKSEAELRESEEKFRRLVEESLVGVFILHQEKFMYVNPQFEKISGYSKEQLLKNLRFDNLVHNDDLQRVWAKYKNRFNGPKVADHYLLKAKHRNGSVVHVELIVSTINYQGELAVLGTIIDITQKVEEEMRINKAVTHMQEMERQEIGMELHDNVKQILAASLLNMDYAQMCMDDPEMAVGVIEKAKKYMGEAIHELRRISHQLAPSIDSTLLLEEKIWSLISTMNVANSLKVNLQIDAFPKSLDNDLQLAIYRIIQEQFSNILKYAKASEATISVTESNSQIIMTIKDNGQGFDIESKKIGIGLENIRRRAQVYNGKVTIDSSVGNGCELKVSIPQLN